MSETLKDFSKRMCDPDACALPNGKIEWRKTTDIRNNVEEKTIYSLRLFFGYKKSVVKQTTLQQKWIGVHAGEVLTEEWRSIPDYDERVENYRRRLTPQAARH